MMYVNTSAVCSAFVQADGNTPNAQGEWGYTGTLCCHALPVPREQLASKLVDLSG